MKQEHQEAFNLVSTVCAHFSGNLETHNKIQKALGVIHGKLDESEPEFVENEDNMKKPDPEQDLRPDHSPVRQAAE